MATLSNRSGSLQDGAIVPSDLFTSQEGHPSSGSSYVRRSNFCKDHRDKIEVPDPLVVEDLISDNLKY